MATRGRKPGCKKTGGRKPGSKNKRTKEMLEGAKAGGLMPVDYFLEILRNTKNSTGLRLDAAKAAAPYLHARRAAEDKHGNVPQERIIETLPGILRKPKEDEDEGRIEAITGHRSRAQ